MFNRPQHQRIAFVLENLKKENLFSCDALFGGGTALSLQLAFLELSLSKEAQPLIERGIERFATTSTIF